MKEKYILRFLLLFPFIFYGQNDLCDNAAVLTPGFFCTSNPVNLSGATIENPPTACAPNASQDVWFKFVANGTSMTVQISAATGVNNGFEIYGNACNGSLVACIITNAAGSGGYTGNNYVVGTTYFIRVFNAGSTPISTPFNVCVFNPNMAVDENEAKTITVFPNPSNGFLTVDFGNDDGIYEYQIRNYLGQMVFGDTMIARQIDIRHLESGVYYLQLTDRDQSKTFTKKFIKY